MNKVLKFTLPIALLMGLSASLAAHPWRDLYGDSLEFDVVRNGERVGQYVTEFRGDGDAWHVEARMELDLRWLFWRYQYRYHAVEAWTTAGLEGLQVRIDQDGERQAFVFHRQGPWLQTANGERVLLPVLPTHHYDVAVIGDEQVVNTLTGEISPTNVTAMGVEERSAAGRTINAQRYQYGGELQQTQVWYDQQGRWVGLEFLDPRGATVEFYCRRCGQGPIL